MPRFLALAFAIALASVSLPAHSAQAAYGDITLLGQTTLTGQNRICDVSGFVNNGREYAIVGNWYSPNRIWIVDVTDPYNPTEVSYVDGSSGFDVKTFGNYAYACDWNSVGNDSRVIDISNPATPILLQNRYRSAHNIAISRSGYLFLSVAGFSLWDLNTTPTAPDSLWHAGNANGHDATPVKNSDTRVWDFAGYNGYAKLWDYTTPSAPVTLCTVSNPGINYYHSGDQTGDGNYLFVCDELSSFPEPDIWVFDVSNHASPTFVTTLGDAGSTVHNLYIIGGLALVSHYNSGFATIDVRNPAAPAYADFYDTNILTGEGYDGAFGVSAVLPSGNVLVSDWDNGLFVFSVEGYSGPPTPVRNVETPRAFTLEQNYPNPFNPSTTIGYQLAASSDVTLTVHDVSGAHVRTLVSRAETVGPHEVVWNGTNDAGTAVASGVYYYRLQVGPTATTRKMVLLK